MARLPNIYILCPLFAAACMGIAQVVEANGFFMPASDSRLRDDVLLLVDERVIQLPATEWPLVREDVANAVLHVDIPSLRDSSLRKALARVAAASQGDDQSEWRMREVSTTIGHPGLLRDDATLGRENVEFAATGGTTTNHYGVTLAVTGVGKSGGSLNARFDGSDMTVRLGNWLLSANQMDRWWGPGRDGSLILSTNARPMPGLSIHRARSLPVDMPVLRWLGPWRFTAFIGALEARRPDVNHPLFMGMRLSLKPASFLEFGLSRTAQFCGSDRPCGLATFRRVLIGQDNAGIRGLDPADEPGNQMAGFDARITSPFKSIPVVVHAQMIGEDNSDASIPLRYLGQFGAETWLRFDSGSVVRAHVEYATTAVQWFKLFDPGLQGDVAYRQGIFKAGYRYQHRNIGHTTDADSQTASIMVSLTDNEGERWALSARRGRLDHYGDPDANNALTWGPSKYSSVQLSWEGRIRNQEIGAQIGHEKQSPVSAGNARGMFGFISWRKAM